MMIDNLGAQESPYFVGRADLIAWLLTPGVRLLQGRRRSGKTSALFEAGRQAVAQGPTVAHAYVFQSQALRVRVSGGNWVELERGEMPLTAFLVERSLRRVRQLFPQVEAVHLHLDEPSTIMSADELDRLLVWLQANVEERGSPSLRAVVLADHVHMERMLHAIAQRTQGSSAACRALQSIQRLTPLTESEVSEMLTRRGVFGLGRTAYWVGGGLTWIPAILANNWQKPSSRTGRISPVERQIRLMQLERLARRAADQSFEDQAGISTDEAVSRWVREQSGGQESWLPPLGAPLRTAMAWLDGLRAHLSPTSLSSSTQWCTGLREVGDDKTLDQRPEYADVFRRVAENGSAVLSEGRDGPLDEAIRELCELGFLQELDDGVGGRFVRTDLGTLLRMALPVSAGGSARPGAPAGAPPDPASPSLPSTERPHLRSVHIRAEADPTGRASITWRWEGLGRELITQPSVRTARFAAILAGERAILAAAMDCAVATWDALHGVTAGTEEISGIIQNLKSSAEGRLEGLDLTPEARKDARGHLRDCLPRADQGWRRFSLPRGAPLRWPELDPPVLLPVSPEGPRSAPAAHAPNQLARLWHDYLRCGLADSPRGEWRLMLDRQRRAPVLTFATPTAVFLAIRPSLEDEARGALPEGTEADQLAQLDERTQWRWSPALPRLKDERPLTTLERALPDLTKGYPFVWVGGRSESP